MVVQAVSEKDEAIEFIEIPEELPEEIIEHDLLLALESNMIKLEDKMGVTARSVLSMTHELKTQIYEIERLEKTIVNMHDFMVEQNDRIFQLEEQLEEINIKHTTQEREHSAKQKGFWTRLFSK